MTDLTPIRRQPAQVTPPQMPGLNSLLSLCVGVVIVAALYVAREVLIPITLAILLSFVLAPLVELLRRIYFPHVMSVLFAVVIGIGILGLIGAVIGVQIANLGSEAPRYATTLEGKLTTLRSETLGRITSLSNRLGQQMAPAGPAETPTVETGPAPVPVVVRQAQTDPISVARSVLEPILAPIENALIIFVVAMFILMQKEDVRDRLIRLFGTRDLHRTTTAMDEAAHRLSRYFLSQLGLNAAFGVIIIIGLSLIGVPSPVLWGVLAAILRFVPYVGSVIAAALPAALAAAVSPHWAMVLWTLGLFGVVEVFTGQFVEPLVYGHSTGLSPVAVVLATIFWAWLWGPIGLVLATPLTLCLVVLGRYVDRLEFLDVLLGNRPALTPVENFYQRMLANDPDEALQQAELLLKERSLTTYYDEVALKGLQLAAFDVERGVLGEERLERIRRSVRSLVEDLSDTEDRDPHPTEKEQAAAVASKAEKDVPTPEAPDVTAPQTEQLAPEWQGEAPVLCLAGKGPLDDAAAAILVQLLGKHGLGARAASYEAVSRENIGALDVTGVALICISYLEITGSPAALHYLVRRLRQRLPKVPILVGLWPVEDVARDKERIQAVVGADYYTTSMREALEICVDLAHQRATETEIAAE